MSDPCVPPPELRFRTGWYWLQRAKAPPYFAEWNALTMQWWFPGTKRYCYPRDLSDAWRYLGPVATYDEVEALRSANRNWEVKCQVCLANVLTLEAQMARLRAAHPSTIRKSKA